MVRQHRRAHDDVTQNGVLPVDTCCSMRAAPSIQVHDGARHVELGQIYTISEVVGLLGRALLLGRRRRRRGLARLGDDDDDFRRRLLGLGRRREEDARLAAPAVSLVGAGRRVVVVFIIAGRGRGRGRVLAGRRQRR